MKKKHSQNTFIYCLLIFIISLLVSIAKYNILPPKYFYDSNKIVNIMNGIGNSDPSFDYAANFYKIIDIFKIKELNLLISGNKIIIDEMLLWSLILSFLGTLLIFLIIIKKEKYSLVEYVFLYASIVLLNIYVFNISKDFIQFLFILALSIVFINKKISNKTKILLMALILIYEALSFRLYYGIMAMLLVSIYTIYSIFFKNKTMTKKKLIQFIILSLIILFLEIFMVGLISKYSYNEIMYARSSVNELRENSLDAVTMITEPLGNNDNIFIFIANYTINFIRMLFPIELLFKGIKYIPFALYQLFITYNLFKLGTNMNNDKNKQLLFNLILSYEMMSVLFEPDFGSFVKHQTAMSLLYMEMVVSNKIEFNIFKLIEKIKLY